MSTTRPFAYNTGSTISGTIQVGDIAVGVDAIDYSENPGGVKWWNGPDENLGYIITHPVSGNTQPTPLFSGAPSGQLTLSPTYIGDSMNLSNGNQTVHQFFGYVQSVLGQTLINGNDKVMFSVLCLLDAPATFPNGHFVGIGTTSMNYNGVTPNPYNSYPGNDNQSIGFNSGGEYWYSGSIVASSLPTWTTNDIIDVSVDLTSGVIWIRVNGGYWNNNIYANPEIGTGGLSIYGLTSFYPVLCPAYEGAMTILNNTTYGVPSGFTLLGTNITASVGFWRSDDLTEISFINLTNILFSQSFTGGTEAKSWLNANGYWTSYADIWQYNPSINLTWPSSTSGYTLYTGGFTSFDDGFTSNPIPSLDTFEMNAQGPSNQVYVSTNGYITFGNGSGQIISTPQSQSSPASVCGNPGDNWLQPGLIMTDGNTQNVYYMTGGTVGRSYIKFIVYGGTYSNATQPTSWLLNFYVDGQYQWVETRVKSNVRGNAGPYNNTDVSIGASTTSQVWRGDLQGQNWVYLGTGSITD